MNRLRLGLGMLALFAAAGGASAQMRLDGTNGPLVLYGTETRVVRNTDVQLIGDFENTALAEFSKQASEIGYFGALVVDRSSAEVAYVQIGLHSVDQALSLATELCRGLAPNPSDCAEAARAVPAGIQLANTEANTLSRAAVPLFIDLLGQAEPGQGFVGVAISGIGHIAVSGPQPSTDEAGAAAMAYCRSFVAKAIAEAAPEQRAAFLATGAETCRVVYVR